MFVNLAFNQNNIINKEKQNAKFLSYPIPKTIVEE